MTTIKKYVDKIDDEICGAKEYAEKALEYKALGDSDRYTKYKSMASDELNHAMTIHEFATRDVDRLKSVYPDVPEDMLSKWEKSHNEYVEKVAWIRQMLSM